MFNYIFNEEKIEVIIMDDKTKTRKLLTEEISTTKETSSKDYNLISVILKTVGIIVIAMGVIFGIIVLKEAFTGDNLRMGGVVAFSGISGFLISFFSFLVGLFLLGIGEVIRLLQELYDSLIQ